MPRYRTLRRHDDSDLRMVLNTLNSAGRSMTARQICVHWSPTWTQDEVESILADLVAMGCVASTADPVSCFVATAVPFPSDLQCKDTT